MKIGFHWIKMTDYERELGATFQHAKGMRTVLAFALWARVAVVTIGSASSADYDWYTLEKS